MSSSNSAFNIQGALQPNTKAVNPLSLGSSLSSGNPVNNALSSMKGTGAPNFETATGQNVYVPPTIPSAPTNQSVTSHTVSPDGTVKQTYATPTSGVLAPSSNKATTSPAPANSYVGQGAGDTIINGITGQTASQAQNNQPATTGIIGNTTTPSGATVNADTGALVNPPANASPSNSAYSGATSGLLNIGTNGSQAYNQAVQNLADFNTQLAKQYGNIESEPIPLQFQQGREQVIARQAASEQAALQGAVQQQQTQQGQQIGALSALGGLGTQTVATPYGTPVYSFGQSGLLNPQVSGNLNSSVAQAVQLFQNGADPNSSAVQALVTPFGLGGTTAFTTALQQVQNGTYNPTAASAIAAQNASQGQTYQGKATELNTTLSQLNNVTAPIMSLINGAGLNQQNNPFFNQSINTYQSQLTNPAAQASLKAGMAEIDTYVSQILGSGGDLTPTAVTQLTASFDPGNFTASQLQAFLTNLDNYGQARLQGYQQSEAGSYGGATGYSGATANLSPNSVIPPNNPASGVTSNNPVIQGIVGTAMGSLESIINAVHGVASTIFGS